MITQHTKFMDTVKKNFVGGAPYVPLQGEKLSSKIAITPSMYIVFGGMPGSGKTAIVDTVFVLEIFDWWLANKDNPDNKISVEWIYRSMERNQVLKRAKWMAYRLYKDHNVLIDVPTIMSWGNKLYTLSDELIGMMESYDDYFEELFEKMSFISGAENPTGVYNHAVAHAAKRGKVHTKEIDTVEAGVKTKKKILDYYEPDNPNNIVFHITDHIGKLKQERGFNDKQIIDKHSELMGILRDVYLMVPIDITQLNRNIEDTVRGLKTDLDIQPKDFKGSADPYENADIVFGLINPYKLKDFDYAGYDIKQFVNEKGYNRFRGMKILKNSYGIDDFRIGYNFIGENGIMREIPSSEDLKGFGSNKLAEFYARCTNMRDDSAGYLKDKDEE